MRSWVIALPACAFAAALLRVGLLSLWSPPAGAQAIPDVIAAHHFVLQDTNGQARADLELTADDGVAFRLIGRDGTRQVQLTSRDDIGAVTILGPDGSLRAGLVASPGATALYFNDANGFSRLTLEPLGGGASQLSLGLADGTGEVGQLVLQPGTPPHLELQQGMDAETTWAAP